METERTERADGTADMLGAAEDAARDVDAGRGEDAAPRDGAPIRTEHYKFFNHAACEFYPCHDMPAEELNCLFCFCPLYCLGDACGGAFTYIGDIKDCSACTVPHRVENYDYLMQQFERVKDIAARSASQQ